jgi:hypothetical protein
MRHHAGYTCGPGYKAGLRSQSLEHNCSNARDESLFHRWSSEGNDKTVDRDSHTTDTVEHVSHECVHAGLRTVQQ